MRLQLQEMSNRLNRSSPGNAFISRDRRSRKPPKSYDGPTCKCDRKQRLTRRKMMTDPVSCELISSRRMHQMVNLLLCARNLATENAVQLSGLKQHRLNQNLNRQQTFNCDPATRLPSYLIKTRVDDTIRLSAAWRYLSNSAG